MPSDPSAPRDDAPPAPPAAGGAGEPPPIFGTWGGWDVLYAIVIGALLLMILVCAAITRWGAAP